jgi:tetratricopeptide (TPR) repeat protein
MKHKIRLSGVLAACLSLAVWGVAAETRAQGSGSIGGTTPAAKKTTPPARKPAPKPATQAPRIAAAPVRVRPKPKPRPGGGKSNAELADEYLAKGNEARQAKNNEEAIANFLKAAQLDPADYESRALLAFTYADDDDTLDEALRWANQSVRVGPTSYYSHVSLAWVQFRRRSYREAENAYRTSLRIAEQNAAGAVPAISYELARTLSEERRYNETLPLLQKAIQADPKDFNYRFFYGVMLQKVGQLNQAAEQYRQASFINDKESAPYSNSGLVYYMLSDGAKARQAWETAISKGSTYLPDSVGLLILRCDLRGAREKLEAYTSEAPGDEDGWLLLGDVLRAQGNDSDARMSDARAAAIAPEYSGLRRPTLRCSGAGVASNPPRPNSGNNSSDCQNARTVNDKGETMLMVASAQSRNDLIPTILACGLDPNAVNKTGMAALTYAAAADNAKGIELLLQAGARVNAKNKDGVTALMVAAYLGKEGAVKALVARGADVNLKDGDGKTAIIYAREKGFPNIVKILEKAAW